MKKSLVIFAFVAFLSLLLFTGIQKVQAYTQQDCINIAMNCATRCINSVNVKNININNLNAVSDACAQNCINEITAYCKNVGNSQPQVQQPQEQQPQQEVQQQEQRQPTPQESIPISVEKGKDFWYDFSGELVTLLGPDSSGGPYTFSLDTMGGFPPMGLILGPDGVLKGIPTGKDSKFRACVKDVGGNSVCKIIDIKVQKEGESEFVVPGNFHLTELAYNNLTNGKQFQSGKYERVAIKMPDGSLLQMDMNSTVIPVSDYEVKSDVGKYSFDYKPATGRGCGPIGQSPTWACRQVDARDATLRVKGTEFLVDSDKYGTNITVIKGLLSVSDTNGKKTVEVAGGQYTYIKQWGLPTDPQSFDSSQVDFWWKEKTAEQIKREKIIKYTAIFLLAFLFILFIKRRQIWPKRFGKPVRTVASTINSNYEGFAVLAFLIGCVTVAIPLNLYLGFYPLPLSILNFVTSTDFFIVKMVGLVLGIIALKSSKKSFAIIIIVLNIAGIVLGSLFGF